LANGKRKTTAKRKLKNRPARARKTNPSSNPLPPPVEVTEMQSGNPEQSSEPKSGGLLEMFRSSEPKPENLPGADGSLDSSILSSDPETARLLDSIPDAIGVEGEDVRGGEADDAGGPGDVSNVIPFPAVAGPVSEDVLSGVLLKSFAWVAEWRKRECYRLTDKDAGTLAQCTLPVLNPWVSEMLAKLLGEWAQTNPALIAMVIGWSSVVGPMIAADMAQSSLEAMKPRVSGETGSTSAPRVTDAKPTGKTQWMHTPGEEAA
jgi:hypothetical protein